MVPFEEEFNKGKRMVYLHSPVERLQGNRVENLVAENTFGFEITRFSFLVTSLWHHSLCGEQAAWEIMTLGNVLSWTWGYLLSEKSAFFMSLTFCDVHVFTWTPELTLRNWRTKHFIFVTARKQERRLLCWSVVQLMVWSSYYSENIPFQFT